MTIDTSLPTIVPPLPVLARAAITPLHQAFAQLDSPLTKASLTKASEEAAPVRAKRKVATRTRPKRILAYRAPPEALPSGWMQTENKVSFGFGEGFNRRY